MPGRILSPMTTADSATPGPERTDPKPPEMRRSSEVPLGDVLRSGSVTPFLLAVFLATVGVAAETTALGKQVFDLTRRELDLGWLGLAEFAPIALLVIIAGGVADRFDRRRILSMALIGEAACLMGLAIMVWTNSVSLTRILAIVFAFGVFRAFAAPTSRALPVNLVETVLLPRLIALNSVAWQSALIVGPVIAGLLYVVSPAAPHVFAASCALIAAAVVSRIHYSPSYVRPTQPGPGGTSLRSAFDGIAVIRRNPILLGAISLDLFAVLLGGAVALLPAIADERLGVGAVGLGWLRAAGGMGAATAAGLFTFRPLRRRVGPTLFVVVAIFGAATIGLGLTTNYVVALAMLFIMSAADSVSVFIRSTLGPLVTPDEVRGRVVAVESVFIGASNELGAFESGVAGALIGAAGAIVFGGVATLVVAAVWCVAFPAIRRVDDFDSLRPSGSSA